MIQHLREKSGLQKTGKSAILENMNGFWKIYKMIINCQIDSVKESTVLIIINAPVNTVVMND